MMCPLQNENSAMLLDYCARRLDPAQSAWFEHHSAECPECREFVQRQQSLWSTLEQWESEPISLDFTRRVFERIEREESLPWWRRMLLPTGLHGYAWFKPAIPLAFTVAACLTLVLMRSPEPAAVAPPAVQGSATIHVEKVDVEQVERALEDMDMLHHFPAAPNSPSAGTNIL